ncbi:MAG: hypothetical protein ABJA87_05850 [bacterium]
MTSRRDAGRGGDQPVEGQPDEPPTTASAAAVTERRRALEQLTAAAEDDSAGGAARRRRALLALVPVLVSSARSAGVRAVTAGRWLADVTVDVAQHLPVRDAATLRRQYPGRSDEEIAAALVATAARASAAIGAAAGAVATVEFAAPPTLLAAPIQLAAETVAVVTVELKMVAELHELAGRAAHGPLSDRGAAYLTAWVHRRALTADMAANPAPARGVLGETAKRELRIRLLRRMGRSTMSLAPFLAGAVAGAEVNRRATRNLGERLRADLGGRSVRHADIIVPPPGR